MRALALWAYQWYFRAMTTKIIDRSIVAVFIAFLMGSNSVNAATNPFSGEPGDGTYPVIDAHTHNHFTGKPEPTSKIPDTLDQYLKEMKDLGIVGAVVHTGEHQEGYQNLDQYNVIHCAGTGADVDVKAIESGLKSGIYRCIKIYLGYVHQWAYDKKYEPAYQLAEKYHVPVVFHTGDTYSVQGKLKFSDPLTIDEVAVDHPKVHFVIAHCGNPWIESAAEVAYKNPNVYLDGSALEIGIIEKLPKKEIMDYIVKPLAWIQGYVEDPTKLMYGTDWPLSDMKGYLAVFKQAVPKKYWKQVFYENATKVFSFPNLSGKTDLQITQEILAKKQTQVSSMKKMTNPNAKQ